MGFKFGETKMRARRDVNRHVPRGMREVTTTAVLGGIVPKRGGYLLVVWVVSVIAAMLRSVTAVLVAWESTRRDEVG